VIVAFGEEEQVELADETLTLRLDFAAITRIEGALDMPMNLIAAHVRSPHPQLRIIGQVLWSLLREHHPEFTLDQAAGLMFAKAQDGAKMGFALDALLERAFPIAEDRKPKNPPKRRGRSKSSGAAG
jgi:hypothetical protein